MTIPIIHIPNIPAITKVHECRRLDTGVGPSIASGSHRYVIAVTDLNVKARTKHSIVNI